MPNYVPGVGSLEPKVMVVGQSPGAEEDAAMMPFVGPSGKELHTMMCDAGYPNWREITYVTNVSKFRPPNNDFGRLHEVTDYESEVKGLWQEIRGLRPNVILALGDDALRAVSGKEGIHKYRGSILQSIDGIPKVVGTFHPANLVRSARQFNELGERVGEDGGKVVFKYAYRTIMVQDIKRAFEESEYQDLRLPQRDIVIARSSADVYKYIQRFSNIPPMVDIESYRCIPVCLSLAFNRFEALVIPLFRRIGKGVQLCDWTDSDIAHAWNILDQLFRTTPVMGHNFKYDIDKLMMLGFRFLKVFADTMMLAHTTNPEMPSKKLEFLCSTLTREPYYKDEGKEWHPKLGVERLFRYNGKDGVIQYEVFEELDKELDYLSTEYKTDLRSFFYNYVMRLFPLYHRMENRGVQVDESQRDRIRFKYELWHEHIQNRFIERLGHELNVSANDEDGQVQRAVYTELGCPKRGRWENGKFKLKVDNDTLSALMQNQVKDERRRQILSDILEDRRVRKTLGTYVNAEVDFDGRLRTSYRICGTETGRSSTGILKAPLRPSKQGMAFQTITKHGDIGADIREFIVPDKGKVFVNVDKSQAEARVVSVLSKDWELLDAFNRIDIHRRTAALIFEYTRILDLSDVCPIADKIGKDSPERFMGKKTRHAGNYNMKKHRFMTEVTADAKKFGIDVKISEWKAGKILELFHNASPKIRGEFHKEVIEAIDKARVLLNPFGRIRMFFERAGEDLYKEAFAYIPQSTVHDSLTQAWIRVDEQKPDVEWLMESHDSLLFQCREDEVIDICKVLKKEIEKPIDFRNCTLSRDIELVIPMDIEIGYENLSEMKKFKLPKEEERAA